MKRQTLTALFVITFFCAFGQPPATEIYLVDLKVKKESVSLRNPRNITNHPGYDNQPFFHPDKSILYYTAADETGNTDIRMFELSSGKSTPLTKTTEKEYSPTVTPDKQYISCIIQRDNGAQDLGKYPIAGGEAIVLINNLTIGYHAWVNDTLVVAFVLDPNTFRLIDVKNNNTIRLADVIGRSLHRIPGSSAISFVDKSSDTWVIKKFTSADAITRLINTLPNSEDLAWTPDGKIMMSNGKKFYFYDSQKSAGWQEITLPDGMPAGTITRLAINPNGDKLAFVVSE